MQLVTPASLAFLALSPPAAAQGGPILPAEQHATGNAPIHAVTGDVTADGLPDLVVANGAGHVVAVLPSDGLGGLLPRETYDVGGAAAEVAIGAIGGGGGLDVVAAIPAAGKLAVLRDDGAGELTLATYFDAGATPVSVALGDVDGDGDLDAACAREFFGAVGLLKGDGAGGFAAPIAIAAPGKPVDAALADADLDGDLDLLVGNEAVEALQVLVGDGLGGFGAPSTYGSCPYVESLEVGDLDANGHPDVVLATHAPFGTQQQILLGGPGGYVASQSGVPWTGRCAIADVDGDLDLDVAWPQTDVIALQLGDGAGGLGAPGLAGIRLGVDPTAVAFDDFDQDGVLDAAACVGGRAAIARGLGGGAFADARQVPLAKKALALAPIDADSDGVLDLATFQTVSMVAGEDALAVARGLGGAAFAPATPVATFAGIGAGGFAAGDLDGDGRVDLLAGHAGGGAPPGKLHAFQGDGAGGFAPAGVSPVTPGAVRAIELVDLDRDGALDAVVGTGFALVALRGNGAGGFAAAVEIASGGCVDVAAGDVDLDGAVDVAGARATASALVVALGDGAGGFGAPATVGLALAPRGVAIGDLGGDGLPDLAAAGTAGTAGSLAVLAGDGAGGFGPAATHAAGDDPAAITLVDLDADLARDVAVTSEGSHRVGVYLQQGAGVLAAERRFPSGFQPTAIAAADLDADGLVDLTVAHDSGLPELYVLRGLRPAPPGTQSFGAGTPGCAGAHGLVASGPAHVGDAGFALVSTNAPPHGIGVRLLGLGADAAGSDPAGIGLVVHVDPLVAPFLVAATFTADAAGHGVAPLPIPALPSLAGVTAHAQAVWLWSGACKPSALGLSSSAGLHVTVLP